MKYLQHERCRWQLADLLDLEALLASRGTAVEADQRRQFSQQIRPCLTRMSASRQRRCGLYLWLNEQRKQDQVRTWPGEVWQTVLRGLQWLLMGLALLTGMGLAWGLSLGHDQQVHVLIFLGLTLALPWLGFIGLLALRGLNLRQGQAGLPRLLGYVLRPWVDRWLGTGSYKRWLQLLGESCATRRAAAARLARLLQWAGLSFVLGAILAFVASLMLFDVRFYWEATLDNAILMERLIQLLSWPWAGLWPRAAPDEAIIQATRMQGLFQQGVPGGMAAGQWWRFLFMSLLVWGLVPRLLLIAFYRWREAAALQALDFQARRHRQLWRALAGVERSRGNVASADNALVLDVGGHGIEGEMIRGFMLRRLRLNPCQTQRVDVLDDQAERAADHALAQNPGHVVLLALDWSLSPRALERLQARVRQAVGRQTPVTWLILAEANGQAAAPADQHLQHWTQFIDNLRDPAVEIVAYDPST